MKNTGQRAGDEVVQMYVRYPSSSVDRPLKELKGFRRITLEPNEQKTVDIPLKAEAVAYWDESRNQFVVEEGAVEVLVGDSSADLRLKRTVTVEPKHWTGEHLTLVKSVQHSLPAPYNGPPPFRRFTTGA